MDLLLLLTSMLLSSYFHPGIMVNARRSFMIRSITLSIEPSATVTRGTNVTLRCSALVSTSGEEALTRGYTIFKDNKVIYTKNSSTSEDLLYQLPEVRVPTTGKYKCMINIDGNQRFSDDKKLTVTGLSRPVLHFNNTVIKEGEELTAWCTAPGETGLITFYFYEGSKEIKWVKVTSNQAEAKFHISSVGTHEIHCTYSVHMEPDSVKSEKSNTVTVSIEELPFRTILEIVPEHNIYEGDPLDISCTISEFVPASELYLSQGEKLLGSGDTKINYSMVANAKDVGEFECRLDTGQKVKATNKTIQVLELFSAPTLTMSPPEVFQNEHMTLTCKCESFASERLSRDELIYNLQPPLLRNTGEPGVFVGLARMHDFNYTCVARAKGIVKHSQILAVRPKVSVSAPKISVVGKAVLGKPFQIRCQSDSGSLPINYTLLKDDEPQGTISIKRDSEGANFTARVKTPDEINKYKCVATNSHRGTESSESLNAIVIEPLSNLTMIVIPEPTEIFEGQSLTLICRIKGTPPVTFKWYRVGSDQPLDTTTTNDSYTSYEVPISSKKHSGTYYCNAVNYANNIVHSKKVIIDVRMALWKKTVIVGFCLLAVLVVVVTCVLYFRSKRAKVDRATVSVWSKRPTEEDVANDEESSMVSSEPDVEYTEVVHPRPVDPARVPLRKGTDTVYSELQNSPHGPADHHDYLPSVEYAELNSEQPDISHYHPEVNSYQDLPEPVD